VLIPRIHDGLLSGEGQQEKEGRRASHARSIVASAPRRKAGVSGRFCLR
jgi:hypothetical protein